MSVGDVGIMRPRSESIYDDVPSANRRPSMMQKGGNMFKKWVGPLLNRDRTVLPFQ